MQENMQLNRIHRVLKRATAASTHSASELGKNDRVHAEQREAGV